MNLCEINIKKHFRNLLVAAFFAVSFFAFSNHANAADYFAGPGASGNCLTVGTPCSIQSAVNLAQPGDTVKLLAGTYTTTGTVPFFTTARHGEVGNRITITTNSLSQSAVLDGAGSTATGINIWHSNITVENLELINIGGNGIHTEGNNNGTSSAGDYGNYRAATPNRHYYVNGADNVIVRNVHIHNHQSTADMIRASRSNNYLLEDCEFSGGIGGNAVDFLASYGAIMRGNYFHDSAFTISMFAKGGSEDVLVENNTFIDSTSPSFGAIQLGQDTEWYNNRYTPSLINPNLHTALPLWDGGDNDTMAWMGGVVTATGIDNGNPYIDFTASTTWYHVAGSNGVTSDGNTIIPGSRIWKWVGDGGSNTPLVPFTANWCSYGTVVSATSSRITIDTAMTTYTTAGTCSGVPASFATNDQWWVMDPITDQNLYVAETMAECRNCTARGNLVVSETAPLVAQNCVNCDFINNTIINSGGGTGGQGWLKLWHDNSSNIANHVCKNIRSYNNIFYNDINNPVSTSYDYVQDKEIASFNNVVGFSSDYNLLYDASQGGNPGRGEAPAGNDTHSISVVPSLDSNYVPLVSSGNIDVGYDAANDLSNLLINDQSGFTTDSYGTMRGSGSGWDIGAYEYLSGDVLPPANPAGLAVL